MMELKLLKLCLSLLLLTSVINGEFEELTVKVNKLINDGVIIDNLFKPLKYIDAGGFCVVYKGERISDNLSVAMKFSPLEHKDETDREFRTYEYLHAVDKMDVEQYGIPPILYYKELQLDDEKCVLSVFSLLDGGDLLRMSNKGYFSHAAFDHNVINSLIVFRDFIVQSKYLHSCGVRHDDIKPDNIMLRKHQSFLIDFNLSCKMKEEGMGSTPEFASRRNQHDMEMDPLDDWESFLYTMAAVNDIELDWLNETVFKNLSTLDSIRLIAKMKENVPKTMNTILGTIKSPPLRYVYLEFAKEVFQQPHNSTPRYDHMFNVINDQIKKVLKPNEIAVFTWLSDAEKQIAKEEITNHPLPEITTLTVPEDFAKFEYPEVRYDYFYKKVHGESLDKNHHEKKDQIILSR